jgi:hypothetical protein
MVHPQEPRYSEEELARILAELEVPFDPATLQWRVTVTSKDKKRGQVIAYGDQRVYIERLNRLLKPTGWTRDYITTITPTFKRDDGKEMAKVLLNCKVTLLDICSHSSTGEEWIDDDNASTAAEAQAFKRACACFGLGEYLYHLPKLWVDIDERRQPLTTPSLPAWATPKGWRKGLRPSSTEEVEQPKKSPASAQQPRANGAAAATPNPVPEKITIAGQATELNRDEKAFWLTLVGEKEEKYLCATQQMDLIERLLRVNGKQVELLVAKINSSKGPAFQIHKVVSVNWKGGRS